MQLSHVILLNFVVQSLSCVWLLEITWTAAHQASLSITNSQSLLKLMYSGSVMLSTISCSVIPFSSCPQSFPTSGCFYNESALRIRWPKYWSFSFSIRPSNEYSGLIFLGLTGLISLLSKGLSRVFSNTTIWEHQFFSAQPSLWSNSHTHTWLLE